MKLAPLLLFLFTAAAAPSERSLKICVADDAPAEVRQAAERVLAAVAEQPLLRIFAGEHRPAALTSSSALLAQPPPAAALDHLVIIGLPSDSLLQASWSHEARLREGGGLYVFGFGHLQGDVGLVESDRNPFLHSRFIAKAPYETEIVTLTGANPAGVVLAVAAFLEQGLINGVVARSGWSRPAPNLLQHDPLPPGFTLPPVLSEKAGAWQRAGVTQAAEDEYRGVLADTGTAPLEIWRAKYYRPGVWDGAGAAAAFTNYAAGLQRRATGNSLWAARFATEAEAAAAAPKIAEAAKLKKAGAQWKGDQPPFGSEKESPGPLTLAQPGAWVLMSTVPEAESLLLAP